MDRKISGPMALFVRVGHALRMFSRQAKASLIAAEKRWLE